MIFTDETFERRALDCEQLASWLRFMFGCNDITAARLMVKAERLRHMKRGY